MTARSRTPLLYNPISNGLTCLTKNPVPLVSQWLRRAELISRYTKYQWWPYGLALWNSGILQARLRGVWCRWTVWDKGKQIMVSSPNEDRQDGLTTRNSNPVWAKRIRIYWKCLQSFSYVVLLVWHVGLSYWLVSQWQFKAVSKKIRYLDFDLPNWSRSAGLRTHNPSLSDSPI